MNKVPLYLHREPNPLNNPAEWLPKFEPKRSLPSDTERSRPRRPDGAVLPTAPTMETVALPKSGKVAL